MNPICKNCEHEVNGNFCSECGQSTHTHPINFHYLWHDIQHGIFHFDKGLLFTAKELFTRPGHSIREFIQGKRVSHFKPTSLVFLLGSFYGLLYHFFHIEIPANVTSEDTGQTFNVMGDWITAHYALATLFTIPLLSIASFLAFRKTGYNLVEHLVLNGFIAGQKLMLQFIFFPLLYIYSGTQTILLLSVISVFIDILLAFWTYNQFFDTQSTIKNILKTILTYIYLFIMFTVLTIAIGLVLELVIKKA
ncbi:DUF3667 domain-containing protein [uncultured Flavobacterium sp.]|uniref:DUF3667 domain-containing protein n=1 Tax=uncultured Flavobacterium sp. TaxID=165435 RepID=UPI0011FD5206|nr:DUF3667 domain-containing protein [uncultured Flavobacterium sp.]THD31409.1 MAG: DUF3667 domain-containing protein [Flavobacterium johnsoniae]